MCYPGRSHFERHIFFIQVIVKENEISYIQREVKKSIECTFEAAVCRVSQKCKKAWWVPILCTIFENGGGGVVGLIQKLIKAILHF